MPVNSEPVERTCPYCGSVTTSEDFFCRACHKRFELRGAETDPTKMATLPEGSVLDLRNPFLAGVFSFIGMGLGQFYNGDTVKGLLLNAIYLPAVLGYIGFPYLSWILIGAWVVSIADAPISSWRINHLATDFKGPSLLFWVELAILILLFGWYLVSGEAFAFIQKMYPAVQFLA
ncbi:MAG: hypothetical protein A4E35_01613 [Methanoregula sp. PtaU1.Bin051]|nr:MAG: hypothetical protein A4E35_01613 [Methanoregula sp. PtaU1.Bin051]